MDVNCPGHRATVLVALAWMGGTPMLSRAGNDRKDPPPATEFKSPAISEAVHSHAVRPFRVSPWCRII